ncbi:zinc finger protein jing homolog isoform X1 [Cloeon dipterum]|uniref:zinc finger protein jing homolog isoform X1 n=1 Tax=Cloeon dipterum TaxID=197152 RepID=UPI0032206018
MAEAEPREVPDTTRLASEKAAIAEKNRPRRASYMKQMGKETAGPRGPCNPVAFLASQGLVFDADRVAADETRDIEEDPLDNGEPKKRCCDRYDSSESSDSGVVVLSSTDCSSCSSSGCSGHSDITEPGSPYSSPGPCPAPGSPDEFLQGSEESEDAPSPKSDPRPPDPDADWAYDDEDGNNLRKRSYPWKGMQIANLTPKQMRVEDELDNNNANPSPQQTRKKQWPVAGKLDAKGQIKITEFFKTQVKAKSSFKKEIDVKVFPAQVKDLLLDSKQQLPSLKIKSSIEEEEEDWSKNTASYVKSRPSFFKDERPKEQEALKHESKLEECITVATEEPAAVVPEETISSTQLDMAIEMCRGASTNNVITNGDSLELENKTESATVAPLSPILSQPKVIRFPVRKLTNEKSQAEAETVRCCWKDCQVELTCGSKLLEHLQSQHVHTQTNGESFVCMWVGCKVYDKTSCSRSWLERHVLTHGGSKPFRCIVDGCGQRFSTQTILQRHINSHFSAVSNGSNGNGTRKSTDGTSSKLFKRNGKKLRLRRQPWSARMFDYMDGGKMEGVTHRLMLFSQQQMDNISNGEQLRQLESGRNLALRAEIKGSRTELDGTRKVLVHWHPEDVLPDEWLKESEYQATKVVPMSSLPSEGASVLHHSLLPTNNKVTRRPRKAQTRNRSNHLCS